MIPTTKYRKQRRGGQAFADVNGRGAHYLGPLGTKASTLAYDRVIAEWLQHGCQIQARPQIGALTVVVLIGAYLHYPRGYYRNGGRPTSEVESVRLSLRTARAI